MGSESCNFKQSARAVNSVGDLQVDIFKVSRRFFKIALGAAGVSAMEPRTFSGHEKLFASYATLFDRDYHLFLYYVGLGAIDE